MNFQQLRYVREAVRRNFNLTEVANVLFTSQPGVSKQIKDFEDELGVEIFVRHGKRLLGLTEPGKEIIPVVERMLLDARNLRRIADHFSSQEQGGLTIATTHTQARYALPKVVHEFKAAFPRVHLSLRQASPSQIVEMVMSGEADIGISTEALDRSGLVTFPAYSWHHVVVVPEGHPLTQVQPLTLEALAEYPIVTYDEAFTGRSHIDAAFAAAGLVPDVVLTAIDADVIKTYVDVGLGVGIVASMAVDPRRDVGLTMLDAGHLFESNTTRLGLRRGVFLRAYTYRFIEMFSRQLDEEKVRKALEDVKGAETDD